MARWLNFYLNKKGKLPKPDIYKTKNLASQFDASVFPQTINISKATTTRPKQFEVRVPDKKERSHAKNVHEQSGTKPAKKQFEKSKSPPHQFKQTYEKREQENDNPNQSNPEKNLLNWFDDKYKHKSKLQPKIAGEHTPPKLIPSKRISEVKGPVNRSDYRFLDSDRSLNISLFKSDQGEREEMLRLPERIVEEESDNENTLSQRIQEYQIKLNDFTTLKTRFRELKDKRDKTGDRSLNSDIERMHSQLLTNKGQVEGLLQHINHLKKSLAS